MLVRLPGERLDFKIGKGTHFGGRPFSGSYPSGNGGVQASQVRR